MKPSPLPPTLYSENTSSGFSSGFNHRKAFLVPVILRWWAPPPHFTVSQGRQTLTHGQAGGDVAELSQLLGDGVHLDAQLSGGNQHEHVRDRSLAGFVDQTLQDGQGESSGFTWRRRQQNTVRRASVPSRFRFSPEPRKPTYLLRRKLSNFFFNKLFFWF